MKAVIVGNPNCGKTTIFNGLTGSRLPVGNRPGVTVKAEKGYYNGIEIYDLPGVYSLYTQRGEEKVVKESLDAIHPNVILNVIDATRLERSLYLTEQLLSFCKGNETVMTVLINMTEVAEKQGYAIDADYLSHELGCPVFPVRRREKNYDEFFTISDPNAYLSSSQNSDVLYDIAHKIAKIAIKENCDNGIKIGEFRKRENKRKSVDLQKNVPFYKRLDKILFSKYAFLPIIILVGTAIALTVAGASSISYLLGKGLSSLSSELRSVLAPCGQALSSFICDGALMGIGGVIQFLPLIFALLFLSEAAEETGILNRLALLFDPFLSPLGLSGKSAVSFFLGCGCTVPAALSTRTASSDDERIRCINCVHFVPCSAKIPLCAMIIAGFTDKYALFLPLLYLSALPAIVAVNICKPKQSGFLLMEFPPLSMPYLPAVLSSVAVGIKSFLKRICTVVFCASIAVWVLSHFDFGLHYCDIDASALASIGDKIKYLFYPLGLYDWRMAVSILAGFAGKETAAGTLTVLTGGDVLSLFDPISATVFIVFILLSPPCAAALHAIKGELPQGRFLRTFFSQLLFAYLSCSLINVGFVICQTLAS